MRVSSIPLWLCWAMCLGCAGTEAGIADAGGSVSRFDFEAAAIGAAPAGFESARTGEGAMGTWTVQTGDLPQHGRVLAQTAADATDDRYPLCIARGTAARDVRASVQFQAREGEIDQAGGLVIRYQGTDSYYLARANALEGNVRFYRVSGGKRKQIGSAAVKVSGRAWHKLLVEARGPVFRVEFEGTTLFTVEDATLEKAGEVGLWTKADSVTWFDDLVVERLDGER